MSGRGEVKSEGIQETKGEMTYEDEVCIFICSRTDDQLAKGESARSVHIRVNHWKP